jgi:phage N-6-adenine-methyltransferase
MSFHDVASSTGGKGGKGSQEWPTPQWLVDQLAAEFGPFDLDPAATPENAKAPAYFTAVDNGLAQPWHGRCWLNMPYGKVETPAWLAKARHEVDCGNAELVVCLVRSSVETQWYREAEADPTVFVRVIGKIKWRIDKRGEAPMSSSIIVYGATGRHGARQKTCANPRCPLPYRRFWPAYRNRETCSERCRKAVYRLHVSQIQSQNGDKS